MFTYGMVTVKQIIAVGLYFQLYAGSVDEFQTNAYPIDERHILKKEGKITYFIPNRELEKMRTSEIRLEMERVKKLPFNMIKNYKKFSFIRWNEWQFDKHKNKAMICLTRVLAKLFQEFPALKDQLTYGFNPRHKQYLDELLGFAFDHNHNLSRLLFHEPLYAMRQELIKRAISKFFYAECSKDLVDAFWITVFQHYCHYGAEAYIAVMIEIKELKMRALKNQMRGYDGGFHNWRLYYIWVYK